MEISYIFKFPFVFIDSVRKAYFSRKLHVVFYVQCTFCRPMQKERISNFVKFRFVAKFKWYAIDATFARKAYLHYLCHSNAY